MLVAEPEDRTIRGTVSDTDSFRGSEDEGAAECTIQQECLTAVMLWFPWSPNSTLTWPDEDEEAGGRESVSAEPAGLVQPWLLCLKV